ncbi:hypothetical protein WJX74_009798 [Apatococcus lobatus]|uniref:Uncharacterized protein n=1 Tax=Apatococcus lobatus TaxID=904363 RepID=A0AAW1RI91_9CHLO
MQGSGDSHSTLPYLEHTYSSRRRRKRDCQDSHASSATQAAIEISQTAGSSQPAKPHSAQPQQHKPLTQLHLDFGQADFSVKSCSICRMQYAPGEPKDERTHAAYHAAVLTGIRFQGWQTERVVRHCPGGSRILLVQQADPPAHWRKVREVTKFMEEQLGFAATWIMSVPGQVLLFVGSNARVQGCLVVETISSAATAPIESPQQPFDNSKSQHAAGAAFTSLSKQHANAKACGKENIGMKPSPLQRWLSTGSLRKAGKLSGPTALCATQQPTAAVLNSIELSRQTMTSSKAHCQRPLAVRNCDVPELDSQAAIHACSLTLCSEFHPQDSAAQSASLAAREQDAPDVPHSGLQQSGAGKMANQPHHAAACTPLQAQQRQAAIGSGDGLASCGSNLKLHARSASGLEPNAARSQCKESTQHGQGLHDAAPIFLRSSRRVIASCGVRAIWVSRLCARQGIATMLLDAARCSCIPGYIMPKGELAFSNLSEDGMGLASSYSGVEGIIQIYEAG